MISISEMHAGGVGGLVAAMLAGLLFSFTPVSVAAVPVVAAYVIKGRALRDGAVFGTVFLGGMLLTHAALGAIAAASGKWVQNLVGPAWNLLTGPILVLLGLIWIGVIKVPLPWLALPAHRVATLGGAFILGALFTVGICPVCSPGLWVGLGASATLGSIGYGTLLLLAFAIGRAVPIMAGAISMAWLETLHPISRWRRGLEVLGGFTLVALGLYLLNDYIQQV
jgi:cytochrome c-type biogenesis protein